MVALVLAYQLWRARKGVLRKLALIVLLIPLLVVTWFARQNHFEWMFAPLSSIAYTKASGIIVDYEHQTAGQLKGVGHPVLINGAERRAGRPPPVLGQHTDDVLGEIGLSSEMIGELRRERVIG